MAIVIRDIRKNDLEPISKINIQAWRESYSSFIDKQDIESFNLQEVTSNRFKNFVKYKKNSVNLVVEEAGCIVGFCEGGPLREASAIAKGEIYTLYISKSHQGTGAGKRLLLEALQKLQKLQYTPILIKTFKENHLGRNFYEHLGGRLIGEGVFNWLSRPYSEVSYLFDLSL